jgi:hypothetical protein
MVGLESQMDNWLKKNNSSLYFNRDCIEPSGRHAKKPVRPYTLELFILSGKNVMKGEDAVT